MVTEGSKKRLHVIYSGRVQGVGFRYTVCRAAERRHVTGYVRNLPDGDVELVAEGDEQELAVVLNAVRNSNLRRYIATENVRWTEATGEFDRFGISY